jgi:hypothetical protein
MGGRWHCTSRRIHIFLWKGERETLIMCRSFFLGWGGSASYCAYFIKVIRRTVPRNNSSRFLFYISLSLHVSALAGHLQAEYTIILGSYCIVLCY